MIRQQAAFAPDRRPSAAAVPAAARTSTPRLPPIASRCRRAVPRLSVALLFAVAATTEAATISLTGQLDPNNPQDVFVYEFTVAGPGTIGIQTWGHGGTAGAPGGANAGGQPLAAGGFDPYVTLFSGIGPGATFVASNDDGSCPPGTPAGGGCRDATLSLTLAAGAYTLAVSAFENLSFAENLGTGALGDGFIGLGSYGGRSGAFAVDISGAALTAPTLALGYAPNGLTFGPQTVAATSGPLTVIVANTGTAPVALGAATVGGADAGDFAVGGDCTGSLAVGASCVIGVTFRPGAAGPHAATLTLSSSAAGSPLRIALAGTGVAGAVPTAALSALDVDLGNVALPQSSVPATLVVVNIGGAALVFAVDVAGGTHPGDFALADGCTGGTIAAGGSCIVSIVFHPTAIGPRTATLTFNSNAANDPVTVSLRGNGVPPAPASAPAPVPAVGAGALPLVALSIGIVALLMRRRRRPETPAAGRAHRRCRALRTGGSDDARGAD